MPISNVTPIKSYTGNGVSNTFAYPFRIFDNTDLVVTIDGVTKTFGADYAITGLDNPLGGNVVFTVAPANLTAVILYRSIPYNRLVDYQEAGDFLADAVDDDLDRAVGQIQQIARDIGRSIKVPVDVLTDQTIASTVAQRVGKIIGFGVTGDAQLMDPSGIPSTAISVFWATVVTALTAAASRTLLDVPSNAEAILDALIDAKGDLIVGTADNTPARKAVGTEGQVLVPQAAQADGLIWTDYTRPNMLINPNWQIDQINEGALYTVNGGANVLTVDAWSGFATAAAGVFKVRQLADPDNAALKCLEITCTTIDAAIAAADNYALFTAIEGFDAAALMWGTASALPVTLSFKFKTSVVGVYGIGLANSVQNRSYVSTITVPNTNENTYSITVPGDTAGAWLNTNGVGIFITITLAAGANFQAAAGAWGAGAFFTTAAQVNFMSNIANIAYLKRIQLIPGSVVHPFAPADIQKELAKAQRYYEKSYDIGVAPGAVSNNGTMVNISSAAGTVYLNAKFAVTKRAVPTPRSYSNVTGTIDVIRNTTLAADGGSVYSNTGMQGVTISSGFAANQTGSCQWAVNARLA